MRDLVEPAIGSSGGGVGVEDGRVVEGFGGGGGGEVGVVKTVANDAADAADAGTVRDHAYSFPANVTGGASSENHGVEIGAGGDDADAGAAGADNAA